MNIFKKLFHPKLKVESTSNTELSSKDGIIMTLPEPLKRAAIELAAKRRYKKIDDAQWDTITADALEYLQMSGTVKLSRKVCIKAIKKAIKKPLH